MMKLLLRSLPAAALFVVLLAGATAGAQDASLRATVSSVETGEYPDARVVLNVEDRSGAALGALTPEPVASLRAASRTLGLFTTGRGRRPPGSSSLPSCPTMCARTAEAINAAGRYDAVRRDYPELIYAPPAWIHPGSGPC